MSTLQTADYTGSCLCGGVAYEVNGELRPVDYCHCSQCRKTSGHFVAAASCRPDALNLIADSSFRWYESSAAADRGFCNAAVRACSGGRSMAGTSVSWPERSMLPTGLNAVEHIYVADASDYYIDRRRSAAVSGANPIH